MKSFVQRRFVRSAVPGVLALGMVFICQEGQAQSNVPAGEVQLVTNTLPLLISNFQSGTNMPKLALQPLTNAIANTTNSAEVVKNVVTSTNVLATPAVTNLLSAGASNVRDFTNVAFLTGTNASSTAAVIPPEKRWWQRVREWWNK